MQTVKEELTDADFPILYQFHNGILLDPGEEEDDEEIAKLKAHLEELHERASRSVFFLLFLLKK